MNSLLLIGEKNPKGRIFLLKPSRLLEYFNFIAKLKQAQIKAYQEKAVQKLHWLLMSSLLGTSNRDRTVIFFTIFYTIIQVTSLSTDPLMKRLSTPFYDKVHYICQKLERVI